MPHTKECEPFIIQTVLTPTSDSSFIHKLILAYSQQLSLENPQFQQLFQEKQDKLSRHNDQLKLLNEMKEDHLLREQVLRQIELKDYEKQYQALIGSFQSNQMGQKPLSYRLKPSGKDYRSFYLPNNQQKSQEISHPIVKPFQKSSFAKQQPPKKFRSSLIKSGSFSSIKKKNEPFSNKTNTAQKSFRNSQQSFSFNYEGKSKNEQILKKKAIIKIENQSNTLKKSKEIYKNSIVQNLAEEENQKQININEQYAEMEQNPDEKSNCQKNENIQEERMTQRTHLKTGASKLPEVYTRDISSARCKDPERGMSKSGSKCYLKDNKQNPYHASNFLRQLNSGHYVSQYNQIKNPTKRSYIKRT